MDATSTQLLLEGIKTSNDLLGVIAGASVGCAAFAAFALLRGKK